MSDVSFKLQEGSIARQVEVGGRTSSEEQPMEGFLRQLGLRAPLDTGWLPPGLRSYSQAGKHAQMVIECQPAINKINWSKYEGGDHKIWDLAQPYRILIAEFVNGNLLGARMFYSPIPFTHLDQPLYHANVPNLNCKGYGNGNGVGWLCLYHKGSKWAEMTIAQKVDRVIERCSGVEAYNDANMAETDGPLLYKEHGKPDYVCKPREWEKKSLKEGVEWTLDIDLWIPVLVTSQDEQGAHDPEGVPLTLGMAMNGKYNAYYGDTFHPKTAVAIRKGEKAAGLFAESVQTAYNKATSKVPTPAIPAQKTAAQIEEEKAKLAKLIEEKKAQEALEAVKKLAQPNCADCGQSFAVVDQYKKTDWGIICSTCSMKHKMCAGCASFHHQFEELKQIGGVSYCQKCAKNFVECAHCENLINAGVVTDSKTGIKYHKQCAAVLHINEVPCAVCTEYFKENTVALHEVFHLYDKKITWNVCDGCIDQVVICKGCGSLHPLENIITSKDMEMLCHLCHGICSECSLPVQKQELGTRGSCNDCAQQATAIEA